jgi:soluble lytic murein transglycosylase
MLTAKKWMAATLVFVLMAGATGWAVYYNWREHREDDVILEASRRYGADPALIKAVVWRETWFDPSRVGHAGEIGLMQLRPLTAQEWVTAEHLSGWQSSSLFDARTNAFAGTWYLTKLLRRYTRTDNPLPYALADYNAGRSHVLQWAGGGAMTNSAMFMQSIGYPGTRAYIESIMQRYARYRENFPPRPATP